MTENDRLAAIYNLVHKIDKEQGVIGEKIDAMKCTIGWLESRVDRLEERTEGLTWMRQSKNVLLWVVALVGGVASTLAIFRKLL